MKSRVKLADIAEQVGVTKMSVSLALRDDPSIGVEKRAEIQRVAREMGYVPNRIARGLASGKTYTIAAVVGGSMHDDYHNQVLLSATQYAMSCGYTLTIGLSNGDHEVELDLYRKFSEQMVDGYLIFHGGNPSPCHKLAQQGAPFLLYTKYFPQENWNHVTCDDRLGGYMLTKYLLSLGHRHIAFGHDGGQNRSEVDNRICGYRQALEEAGLPFREDFIISVYRHPGTSEMGTEPLMALSPRPTAIFLGNDVTAAMYYIALKRDGLRIPEDLSVVGYEGVYLGKMLDPPLTTITTPLVELGRTACARLIDMIESPAAREEVKKITLEPVLTIRNSAMRR